MQNICGVEKNLIFHAVKSTAKLEIKMKSSSKFQFFLFEKNRRK